MQLTDVQDQAIQARAALVVGATIYDRLFAGVRFDEIDEGILIVYPKDDGSADEIADNSRLKHPRRHRRCARRQ